MKQKEEALKRNLRKETCNDMSMIIIKDMCVHLFYTQKMTH
jgi:hypothetical protein